MDNYNNTDQYIHQISKVLAKLGKSFVSQKPDDSHTNLYWEPLQKRMLGRWIETSNGPVLPCINIEDLSFQWLNARMEVIDEKLFENKNYDEIENMVSDTLPSHELSSNKFLDPLHFAITDYPFKNQPFKRIKSENLSDWSNLRSLANHVLKDIVAYLNLNIEVRIWPHHFDTGIYFQWTDNLGIGAGLAMKDSMVSEPYFYISGYSSDNNIEYSKAFPLTHGEWVKTGSWKGGILPVTKFFSENGQNVTQEYFIETIQFLLKK